MLSPDVFQLLRGKRLLRSTGRGSDVAEEGLEPRRRHDPEETDFAFRILDAVPHPVGNEDRRACLDRLVVAAYYSRALAAMNEKDFIFLLVEVKAYPRAPA